MKQFAYSKITLGVLLTGALALAGCGIGGGDDDSSSSGSGNVLAPSTSSSGSSSSGGTSSSSSSSSGSGAVSSSSSSGGATASSSSGGAANPIVWNVYNPKATKALPTSPGSLVAGYGSATTFFESTAGDAARFTIGGADNSLQYVSATTPTSSSVRLCDLSACSGTNDSVVQDTFPKTISVLVCAKPNDITGKNALDIEVAMGPSGSVPSSPKVKMVVQKSGSTSGIQLNASNATNNVGTTGVLSGSGAGTGNGLPVDSSDGNYHLYHLTATMTSATSGTASVYFDGAATPAITQAAGAYVTTSGSSNYLKIGSTSSSTAYSGSVAWVIWTNSATHTSPSQMHGLLPAGLGSCNPY